MSMAVNIHPPAADSVNVAVSCLVSQKSPFSSYNGNWRVCLPVLGIGMPDDLLVAGTQGGIGHLI
jgi:hypothetical protein